MRDKIRKTNPEHHIVGFLKNLFENYGGNKYLVNNKISSQYFVIPFVGNDRGQTFL